MKKVQVILLCIATFAMLCSCESVKNMSKQDKGVAIGATSGAVAGGIIGKVSGNTGVGAVLGAVVGGVAGGVIGHKMDKQAEKIKEIKSAKVEKVNNGEGLKVTFDAGILFATGSSTLSPDSQDALTKFAQTLVENPETNISISGHTDNTGSDAINQPLSEKRAESVANFLALKGVARNRMTTVGNGSKQPVVSNDTPEGRTKNRRVEIIILANEKMVKQAQDGTLK
jgi:outer membrane protein OmpA-like peptidoglycan-associated protein